MLLVRVAWETVGIHTAGSYWNILKIQDFAGLHFMLNISPTKKLNSTFFQVQICFKLMLHFRSFQKSVPNVTCLCTVLII